MLHVGGHVRTLLAVTVVSTLGANAALLLHPAAASAPKPAVAAPAPTTTTSAAPVLAVDTAPVPDLAPAAIAAVEAGGGVNVAGGGRCDPNALQLSFDDPGSGWKSGAFVSPLGPAPGPGTSEVNGIVVCAGSRYAYIGFMAALRDGQWDVELVPDVDLGHDDNDDASAKNTPDKAPVPKPAPSTKPIVGLVDGPDIEGYARYEGQSTCDPGAKPGTLALRNLLLSRYPATKSMGISRGCDVGGRSEHKEGRAFDWGANVNNPAQRAAVDDFLRALFATDSYGHTHALARRMGVMYVIWNAQIWSAYRADAGWQPYSGASAHTDHVHISLSWAGARAETSYYSGKVVPGLADAPGGTRASRRGTSTSAPRVRPPRQAGPSTSTTVRPPRQRRQSPPTTAVTGEGTRDGERRRGDWSRDGRDGRDGRQWSRPPTPTTTTPVPTVPTPTSTTTSTTVAPPG